MVTDEIDETKHLPITEMPEDEENEDSSQPEQKNQEFAHTKDKKKENARNALDAMDIDQKLEEQKNINEIEDKNEQREGKSLDMSKLKDAITVDTHKVQRDTETVFGQSNQVAIGNGASSDINMVSTNGRQQHGSDGFGRTHQFMGNLVKPLALI